MDKALDVLVSEISNPLNGIRLSEKMYRSAEESLGIISYWNYEAMLFLLNNIVKSGIPKKSVLYVEGNHRLKVKPVSKRVRSSVETFRYDISFLGYHFSLGEFSSSKITNPIMAVDINIRTGKKLLIGRCLDGLIDDIYEPKISGFVNSTDLLSNVFHAFTGVCVKKTTHNGSFGLGANRFNYGVKNANKYLLVFFDKGTVLSFDESGELLTESNLNGCAVMKKAKKKRIASISDSYDSFNSTINRKLAEDYLIGLWQSSPEHFLIYGRKILLSGDFSSNTGNHGKVNYFYLINGEKRNYFTVARNLERTDVTVSWRGPHLLITRIEDKKVLNAYSLHNFGLEVIKPRYIPNLRETISLVDLNITKDEIWTTINKRHYAFSKTVIKDHLSDFPNYDRIALFSHVFFDSVSKSTEKDQFYLLVSSLGSYHKIPLECRRTKGL
jgi:hypothetical protein